MIKTDTLIIGANTTGLNALVQLRKNNYNESVDVITKDNLISYGTCGILNYLNGEVASKDELFHFTPQKISNRYECTVHENEEVLNIKVNKQEVQTSKKTYHYKKLVIASGASSINLFDQKLNCFTISTPSGLNNIENYILNNQIKNVAIIGSGIIGVSTLKYFLKRNLNISLIERQNNIIPILNNTLSQIIQDAYNSVGIKTYTGIKNTKIDNKKIIDKLYIDDNVVNSDIVISAVGFKPNTGFLNNTGIGLDDKKYILINRDCSVNIPKIYAGGDCTVYKNFISQKNIPVYLAPYAVNCGRVIGNNISGYNDYINKQLNTVLFKTLNMYIGVTGYNESMKDFIRDDVDIIGPKKISVTPGYIHDNNEIYSIIYRTNDKILGAQLLGFTKDVYYYTNYFAFIIQNEISVNNIQKLNFGYTPEFNQPYNPLLRML